MTRVDHIQEPGDHEMLHPIYTASETSTKRRAEALYESMMRRAASGPYTDMIEVTPELAEILLARNPDNRRLTQRTIDEIARDISEGRWQCNGETIIIADTGELNDGQNRAHAVIKAGRPIKTFCVVGVPRATRTTVDGTQKIRTAGDYLSMDGVADGNNVAAAANALIQIDRYGALVAENSPRSRPTKQEVIDYAHKHLHEIEAAFCAVSRRGSILVASYSLLAVTYILITRATNDPEAAKEYLARVVDGVNLDTQNPIYAVRERLMRDKRERRRSPHNIVERLLRGWNAHRSGLTYSRPQLGKSGLWPKIAR